MPDDAIRRPKTRRLTRRVPRTSPTKRQPLKQQQRFDTTANADATGTPPSDSGSEALIQLALTDLQSRRDALQQEIEVLNQRKQALEKEMTASFAGGPTRSRKAKGSRTTWAEPSRAWCGRWRPWS